MNERKPRIAPDGGPSLLEQLRQLSDEEHDFLLAQKKQVSATRIIAQIASRHGIHGLTQQQLSAFWRWLDGRKAVVQMNADAEQFRGEFAREAPAATAEQIHIKTVDYLRMKGLREDDRKLLAFAVTEARKALVLEQNEQKLAMERERTEVITCRLFLKWFRDARTREIAESNVSNAEKIAQLREFYFSDVDALEKSGEVQLPE